MTTRASWYRPAAACAAPLAAFVLALSPRSAWSGDPPHDASGLTDGCQDCHIAHNAPGPLLTSRADNPTLCLSCHSTKAEPTVAGWTAADQAVPGTSGTSHSWTGAGVNPALGASLPGNAGLRLSGGNLQCSTCHDQHSQDLAPFDPAVPSTAGASGRHFMRMANAGGEMCIDCHAAWNQASASSGTYYQGAQATFSSTGAIVSGSGTSWTTQLSPGSLVKRQSDTAAAWTVVKTVDSNTQLTLVQSYKGTSGTGVPWDAAKMLTHPVGVPLPAASALTRATPVETSGTDQAAGFWGAATGGSTTSLADSGKNFTGATGLWIRFTSGTNRNVTRQITSVTGNTTVNFTAVGAAVTAGTRYEIDRDGNLTNDLALVNGGAASFTTGNLACLSCHEVHFGDSDATTYDDRPPAATGDGHLLRRTRSEICIGCHANTSIHSSANTSTKHGTWGAGFDCRTCHDPHQTSNVHLLASSIATPNLGTAAVDFRVPASGQVAKGHVDASTLVGAQTSGRGPCEACHTDTRNGNVYVTGTVNVSGAGAVTCNTGCAWTASQFGGWEFRVATDAASAWTRITGNTATALTLGSASGNVYAGTKGLNNVAYEIANPRFRGLSAGRNNLGSGEGAVGNEHYETNCLQCHPHDKGFAAGESSGGSACDGCHGDIWNRVTGTTGTTPSGAAIVSKHTLGNVPATNASPNDANVTWADPLATSNPASSRSCVNMCHDDHPHTVTGVTTHEYNAYRDATSQASRAATTRDTATKAKTDFDASAANGGMCLSCHRFSVDANHPAIGASGYGASKHNYTSNTVGASTFTWTYGQHDGGVFDRNCTKCHNDPGDLSPSDTSQPFASVHFSRYPSLLFGNVNPAAAGNTLGGNVCFQCHGDGATGLDRSGVNMAAVFGRASSHPMSADATHDTFTEFNAASAEGTGGGAARHVNCLDCHDPHAAGAAHDTGTITSAAAGSLTDSAKSGRWASNQWVGYRVVVQPYATTPTGSGQTATVTANTTTGQISVASWPAGTPPAGASYTLTKMGTGEVSAATGGVWGVTVGSPASYSVGQATFSGSSVYSGATGGIVTTASTGTMVTSANRNWVANRWAGYTFRAVTGASAGQTRTISSNTQTALTLGTAVTLAQGDLFVVYAPPGNDTLYFLAGAEASPAEPMPNQHQPTTETFAGGTWIGRAMGTAAPTVAFETETITATAAGNYRAVTFTSPAATAAASIPAGSWTINVYASENNRNANAVVRYSVYKWNANDSLGTTVIARTNDATEFFLTTSAVVTITFNGAAVSLVAGDKIVVDLEIYANSSAGYTASYFFGAGAVGSVKMPGRVPFGGADPATPAWTSSMVGGYIRNELDRNGRWYRITGVTQPTAGELHYQATIAPAYSSTGAGALSNTKMTSNTTAPVAQWQMDHGTLYSISTATVTKTASATKEAEICLRCHSSHAFGDAPPDVPSGHVDATAVKETNVLHDFGSGQLSYHPVFAPGLNQPNVNWSGWNVNAAFTRVDNTGPLTFGLSNTFTSGWFKESLTRCSDCHSSDTASDPLGPHGSGKKWLLRGLDPNVCWTRRNLGGTGWETICNSQVPSGTTVEGANYCLNCHRWDVYGYADLAGNAVASILSRVPHDTTGNNNTYKGTLLPTSGIVCNHCHGGDRIAGAHGSARRAYPYKYDPSTDSSTTIAAAPASYSGKRLLNGAYWYGVTRATTSAGVACWGKAGTDMVSLCAHGHENVAGNPAQYSYDDAPDG